MSAHSPVKRLIGRLVFNDNLSSMAAVSCLAQSCVNYFVHMTKSKQHKCNMCLCNLDNYETCITMLPPPTPPVSQDFMIHGLNCKNKSKIEGSIDINVMLVT